MDRISQKSAHDADRWIACPGGTQVKNNRPLYCTLGGAIMKFCRSTSAVCLTALHAALTACGGGGGGDAPTSSVSTASFPVQAIYAKDISTASSYSVTANDASGTYTATVSDTPRSDAVFEGETRSVSLRTVTIKQGNALVSTSSYLDYYGLNPPRSYGSLDTDGEYTVNTATGTTPVTAKVGETWSGYISTVYSSSSKTTVLYNATRNYSLEADTATTAFMCANTIQTGSSLTGANCRKIDTSGNILGYRITLALNGKSITFQ
jgi:hypothetical protein